MDPNLTLAHITHSTAVILLHQGIAYPPQHWQICPVRLPSASSAETCLEEASEISSIGQQFLLSSPIFTNPQFSFCLFIAGRMLLAHARYNQVPIPAALDALIASLLEISQRWTGQNQPPNSQVENLAVSFAKRLIDARNNSLANSRASLDIRQTAYSDESQEQVPPLTPETTPPSVDLLGPKGGELFFTEFLNGPPLHESYGNGSFNLDFPPLPPAFEQQF